ncbi:MAG: ABC transporter permease [Actinomycetota bacterium]
MAAAARSRRALLVLAAVPAVLIALAPIAYLAARALGSGAADGFADLGPAVLRTAALALLVAAGSVLIGVPFAILAVRSALPLRRLAFVLGALPLVIPSYVGALALLGALGPRGLLAQALEPLGVYRLPVVDGLLGSTLVLVLFTYPYVLLLTAAALRRVDPSLERAARGMGRGPVDTFRRFTLPQIRSAVVAGALLAALYAMSDFGVVSLLRCTTLTREAYLRYASLYDPAGAAAVGLVLAALALLVVGAEQWSLRDDTDAARRRVRAAEDVAPLPLGRARIPAIAFVAVVVLLSLVLPLAILAWWAVSLVADASLAEQLRDALPAVLNAIGVSAAAAVVCVALALPVAALVARVPGRLPRLIEGVSYVGYALPGIVVGLGLVFLVIRRAPFLYQPAALIVIAYTVRMLPQAISGARSGWERVDPRFEQAARGMGRGPIDVLARVTLPLAAPGILTGAALVFLTAIKELPATLLLRPNGFETPATLIWQNTAVAQYAAAAVPALILIAVSAVPVYALLVRPEARSRRALG